MLKNSRPDIIVTIAVLLIYAVLQSFVLLSKPVKTEVLVNASAEDTIECDGILYRDEEIITQSGSGITRYSVSEGQRVKSGVKLGSVYRDTGNESSYARIDELSLKIDRLNACMATDSMYLSDSLKAEDNIRSGVVSMAGIADTDASKADALAEELRLSFNRKQLVLGEKSALEADLQQAKSERDALVSSVGASSLKDVYSPGAGYFSQSFDGYENLLNPKFVNDADYSVYKQVYDSGTGSQKPAGYTGKLIKGYDWYYASVIAGDAIKSKTAGSAVNLRIENLPGELIPAALIRIEPVEGGYYCIFKSDYFNTQLARIRRTKVQIVLKTYTGYKVKKDAIRMDGEKTGVFSMVGSQVIFKNVKVLFSKDDFSIITETQGDTVYAGEQIVVDGKNLFDGKVVT